MIFDCLAFTLKNNPGTWNTLMTLGSYLGAYKAYYAVPYVAQTMYMWGGVATVLSMFNLARYLDRNQSIVRAFLLSNRTIVRLELGKG